MACSGTLFFFSVLLLGLCDLNCLLIYVDISTYGKNDSSIFKKSVLYQKLNTKMLNIPESAPETQGNEIVMPYIIVGDVAFSLLKNLPRPFSGNFLTTKTDVFNCQLSTACQHIKCTFGKFSNKCRIFHRPLNVHVKLAEDIIKAHCILHNYV
jgi:hypothetical protein